MDNERYAIFSIWETSVINDDAMYVEEIVAESITRSIRSYISFRGALEESIREYGLPSSIRKVATALGLEVLRKYIFLRHVGRSIKGHDIRSPLALILIYESLYRDNISITRLLDISIKYNLPLHRKDFNELRKASPRDFLKGIKGLRRLSLEYSVPLWVVSKLVKLLGFNETRKLLEAYNKPSTQWLWTPINRKLAEKILSKKGIKTCFDPRIQGLAKVLEGSLPHALNTPYGPIIPRDKLSVTAIESIPADITVKNIYECCSAPGGKTIHLRYKYRESNIIASDISLRRLLTQKNLMRYYNINADLLLADATRDILREKVFDLAVVDPDCTSIGRLGHSPETRVWLEHRGRRIVNILASLQEALLKKAISLVKEKGYTLYTTCTLTLEENEQVIRNVMSEENVIIVEPAIKEGVQGVNMPHAQRLYTHRHDCIGGFIAILQKTKQ